MKFLALILFSIMLCFSGCKKISNEINYNQREEIIFDDKHIVTINDKTYTESDVFEFAFYIIQEIDAEDFINNALRRSILEEFIDHTVLYQQAEKEGFTATDNHIDKILNMIKTDKGAHELKINTGFYATDSFKMSKTIQQRFIIDKSLNRVLNQEINISEDRIRDYYNRGLGSAKSSSKLKLSQIFSHDKTVVEKALEELSQGFSFSEVAMRYSESPEGKDGGSLGYIERSEVMPDFISDALKSPVGRYTGVIKSDYGYHIFYLAGAGVYRKPPYSEIKKIIEQEIKEQEQEQIIKRYIHELRAKNKITIIDDIDLFDYQLFIASRGNQ